MKPLDQALQELLEALRNYNAQTEKYLEGIHADLEDITRKIKELEN